jgi:cell division septation protein DedD
VHVFSILMSHTMKLDFAQVIERLLYQQDNLVIPGLGIFTSKPSNATIDYLGATISPPSKVLSFDETVQTDDGLLLQYLVDEMQIEQTEARKLLEDSVAQMKETLDNREIVTLAGVGRLYKNYARKIQFLPETTNFRADSFGLPGLDAPTKQVAQANGQTRVAVGTNTPASPAAVTAPVTPEPSESFTPPVMETPEPTPAAPTYSRRISPNVWLGLGGAMIVLAASLGWWLMKKKQANAANPEVKSEVPLTPVPTPIGAATAAIEQDKAQKAANEQPAIASPKDDISDVVDEATAQQIEARGLDTKGKASAAATTKPAAKPAEKPKATASGKRCVLVLGAFNDRENVEKLLEKLKTNGYDTYHRRDNQKRHQIGIEFQYDTMRDIQVKMEELQKLTGLNSIWIKKK